MTAVLYTLPGSHPCDAVAAAFELKKISFKRRDLLPLTQLAIGPLRFGGTTVPGVRIDGERIVGSRTIMRRLDELVPTPPLLPADPSARTTVLGAEEFGETVLQSVPRRIIDAAFRRDPASMFSYAAESKLPLPAWLLRPSVVPVAALMSWRNKADDTSVQGDIATLPQHFDRIEAWIADGVLGAELPNAADLQIGSTIRLLLSIGDVVPMLETRPCAALARYFPPLVGAVAAGTLPSDWF